MALTQRHIQNMSEAAILEPHWGYADRALPCTSDPGSCAYLDVVYSAHDLGMLYTGIFWLTIGGILLVWALGRRMFPPREPHDDLVAELSRAQEKQPQPQPQPAQTESQAPRPQPTLTRLRLALASATRHHLLRTTPLRFLFGHTTRLQLLILTILVSYLTIWSFIGMAYATWVTPIKNQPPSVVNTRTTIGPWADRVGVLAYALTPLSVLLASRESILSLLTGVPYTSFMFLHRWTGYIILIQSALHTLGWALVEARLYQPQPKVWNDWIAQQYAIWGVVALVLLVVLWVLSLQVVVRRVTGYEFFRKAHYVLAMVYIGALIGHWQQLQCFLVPGLLLWGLDRGARLVRMGMLHYGYWGAEGGWGFKAVEGRARLWRDGALGDVVRMDFEHQQKPWHVGQHFFLCFTEGSVWQSHPFTPLSLPVADATGRVKHSYIFRAKGGETRKIAEVLAKKAAAGAAVTTPVILQGPYGENMVEGLTQDVNVLCVAGGTGITYVLPALLRLVRGRPSPGRKMELLWAVKRRQDLEWIEPEMEELRRLGAAHDLQIRTFVTAEEPLAVTSKEVKVTDEKGRTESDDDVESVQGTPSTRSGSEHRPDVTAAVSDFVAGVAHGSTRVFASGPPGMAVELRAAVAQCNSGGRVWKGEERFDVRLVCDDRLEW
ncbi:ferric reductase transmembrane component 3 [Parachaetomium inaequale]|uniref:Ferric reductase transmembrane component 3 n=1 Tax=Parachaetomium inaequale TaxID=2588326 RepID=A0AAN6SPB6_9PEZI|nr:ferric reductase transmembrane component 3 [Parachaetomium inaequale]